MTNKWTSQEKEDAKNILRIFGADNFTHVTKDEDGWPSIMDEVGWCAIGLEHNIFPSLNPRETVKLTDIIGDEPSE